MKTKRLLEKTDHRPWELPKNPWRYYQEWRDTVFLHWQVSPQMLSTFVPSGLEIDLHEGHAWVSLVAFTMKKVRPRYLPSLAFISDFDEINIRTYVKFENKPGVYFLSIEGGKFLSCQLAKMISKLPYRFSKMNRKSGIYESLNSDKGDSLLMEYNIGESQLSASPIDLWLTERYALFQDHKEGILAFDIHHLKWPLSEVKIERFEFKYPRFKELLNQPPTKAHFSKGVQVLAWPASKWSTY